VPRGPRWLDIIGKADHRNRFRMYTPVTAGRNPILCPWQGHDRRRHISSRSAVEYAIHRSLGLIRNATCSVEVSATDAHAAEFVSCYYATAARHAVRTSWAVEMPTWKRAVNGGGPGSLDRAIESLMSDGRLIVRVRAARDWHGRKEQPAF